MAEDASLKDLQETVDRVTKNLYDYIDELNQLKKDIKDTIKGADYRSKYLITENRRNMTDLFRLILDYNDTLVKLKEKVFNAKMKIERPGDSFGIVDVRGLVDKMVRDVEKAQKRAEAAALEGGLDGVQRDDSGTDIK